MWDPPGPGLEPVCPALAGRFSTTAPPGKPRITVLVILHLFLFCQFGEYKMVSYGLNLHFLWFSIKLNIFSYVYGPFVFLFLCHSYSDFSSIFLLCPRKKWHLFYSLQCNPLFSLFALMLELFLIWPATSCWLLCSFNMSSLCFEHFFKEINKGSASSSAFLHLSRWSSVFFPL